MRLSHCLKSKVAALSEFHPPKCAILYAAIGGTFDHYGFYPWVHLFIYEYDTRAGCGYYHKTIEWQKSEPVEGVVWESPESLPGQAGIVEIDWHNGFRLVPEMQDLYQVLQNPVLMSM